jgi:NAD-dependent histone deacetylase SIR2
VSGDDIMAAPPYSGPVAVQEAVPPSSAMAANGPPATGASEANKATAKEKDEDAPAPDNEDDDEGGVWDTASLYEEILDEAEAFEYSANGESGVLCATQYNN